ncbi:MAG: histidine--tRNA ligase [Candidatus Lindowbacteria bacterium RIFCSPLOWO2_12_FULL_62_27]|nr:MAG: histidine--tRNA ligase [Candidatus Lindowbacteria bacterium RIFCSPLOWO2_12_FULL_62_27]
MIQKVRGTRDFFGPEERLFCRIESATGRVFRRYGIQQVRTPIFEEAALFSRSIGEATDIVSKEMYTFADRKGRLLSLRPEGTASVVRFLVEEKIQVTDTLKLFYLGPMFRYERPQAGRYRQFHQFGIEYFGTPTAAADAEVISVGHALLQELGLSGHATLLINSLGCAACRPVFLDHLGVFLKDRAADLCEECRDRIDRNPLRCLDCKRDGCVHAYESSPKISESLCELCRRHDAEVKELLADAGLAFTARDRLVRGLDYYVRTVFEFVTAALGAQDAVIAGGRYDGLVAALGGPDLPAVGFAGGIERLIELMSKLPASSTPGAAGACSASVFFVCAEDRAARRRAFNLAERLRASQISTLLPLSDGKSFKSQFRAADKSGARVVVILGEEEAKTNSVSIKDLSRGEQQTVPESDLIPTLDRMGIPRDA